MHITTPFGFVINRDGWILYNDQLPSIVSSAMIKYGYSDTLSPVNWMLPLGNNVTRSVMIEKAFVGLGAMSQLHQRNQDALKRRIGEKRRQALLCLDKAIEQNFKYYALQIESRRTTSGEIKYVGIWIDRDGMLREGSVVFEKCDPEKASGGKYSIYDYSRGEDSCILPTGLGSEWAIASLEDQSFNLQAALRSTAGHDDLSALLVRMGVCKEPQWLSLKDFIKKMDFFNAIREVREEIINDAEQTTLFINEEMSKKGVK